MKQQTQLQDHYDATTLASGNIYIYLFSSCPKYFSIITPNIWKCYLFFCFSSLGAAWVPWADLESARRPTNLAGPPGPPATPGGGIWNSLWSADWRAEQWAQPRGQSRPEPTGFAAAGYQAHRGRHWIRILYFHLNWLNTAYLIATSILFIKSWSVLYVWMKWF